MTNDAEILISLPIRFVLAPQTKRNKVSAVGLEKFQPIVEAVNLEPIFELDGCGFPFSMQDHSQQVVLYW